MPEYLAPGVYVEETSFRPKPIEGVSTSTAGFVGPTRTGPLAGQPELITNFGEFERVFGGFAPLAFEDDGERANYLAYAVRGFFENGGRRLYVARAYTQGAGNGRAQPDRPVVAGAQGHARFVARFAGRAGQGQIVVTEKATTATWTTMDAAPVGSMVLIGAGTPARPAFIDGTRGPHRVPAGAILRISHGGNDVDLVFTGTRAQRTGDAALDAPHTTFDANNNTLELVVNGQRQTIRFPIDQDLAPQAVVDELNLQLRGGSAALGGGGELVIRSDIEGRSGRVEVPAAHAALHLTAGVTPGDGLVDDLLAVTPADINRIIAGTALDGVLVAAQNPVNLHLRLQTVATGAAASFNVVAVPQADGTSAHGFLGITPPANPVTGEQGANLAPHVKGEGNAWFSATNVQLPRDAQQPTPGGGARLVTATVETIDGDGRVRVYEGLGYAETHPLYIGTVLAVEPSRRQDALENPIALEIQGNQVTPFNLREGLVGADGRGLFRLLNGSDGAAPTPAAYQAALARLADVEGISIVAAPGSSFRGTGEQQATEVRVRGARDALLTHVEQSTRYRIAVLDTSESRTVATAREDRSAIDSRYAALYHPWLVVPNPLWRPGQSRVRPDELVPPSGHVCGIYARNDTERGVHKAPANEVVRGVIRLETSINFAQQEVLNPAGVNCVREFSGRGLRLWGARLASSDPEWKYVSVRRYFNYLEASIDRGTQWAVFEPNGEALWADIRQSVSDFLYTEWRNGALLGSTPKAAYFVRCDRSTMTQNDLDNGRLICEIGVAVVKPAEFVIFRIGQKTADAQG